MRDSYKLFNLKLVWVLSLFSNVFIGKNAFAVDKLAEFNRTSVFNLHDREQTKKLTLTYKQLTIIKTF